MLGGPLGYKVFLLVIMDRRNETRLGFLGWCVEGTEAEAV
jgi:hypothetical protein